MAQRSLVRDGLVVALTFAVGWWAHSPRAAVHAAEDREFPFFQFSNVAGEGSLSLYSPADHTIYVYGGVLSGNSSKQCTYSIRLGRAGAPVERTNCPVGSAFSPH